MCGDEATNLNESIITTNGVTQAKYQPNSASVGDNVITASIDLDDLSQETRVTLVACRHKVLAILVLNLNGWP